MYTEIRRCMAVDFPDDFGPEVATEAIRPLKEMATTLFSQGSSPRDPGVIRLHVNASYFSTTAGRVTSPTRGPPPPCTRALNLLGH